MGALFDFTFKKFVTPTIAKFIYAIGLVIIALIYIFMIVAGFEESAALGLLLMFIVGPLVALFYVCLFRIGLEGLLAAILTAQNTAELVRLGGGTPPSNIGSGHGGGPSGPRPAGFPPPAPGQAPPAGPQYPPHQPPAGNQPPSPGQQPPSSGPPTPPNA